MKTPDEGTSAKDVGAWGVGIFLGGVLGIIGWAAIIHEPAVLWLVIVPTVIGAALILVALVGWGVRIGRNAT